MSTTAPFTVPSTLRILHLDDSPVDRDLVAGLVGKHANLTTVSTLAAAQERLTHEVYDLLVIDLDLSDSTLTDTIEALRPYLAPILVLSGHESPNVIRKAERLGVEGFITKRSLLGVNLLAHIGSICARHREKLAQMASGLWLAEDAFESVKPYITCAG